MTEICFDNQICRTTPDEYLARIQQDLPSGSLWDFGDPDRVQPKFWMAIAEVLSQYQNERCDLYDELDPCSSTVNIKRWAQIFGFPFECAPDATAEDLCAYIKLISSPCAGPKAGFYEDLLTILGVVNPRVYETTRFVGQAGCVQAGCFEAGASSTCGSVLIFQADEVSYVDPNDVPAGTICPLPVDPDLCEKYIPQVECIKRCFIPPYVEIVYYECSDLAIPLQPPVAPPDVEINDVWELD